MTVDENLKLQLGSLMVQVIVLQTQLEEANEKLKQFEASNEQSKIPQSVRLTDENKIEKEKENKL